jgi:membrane-associated PAP2 superfamily phosphatase
VNARASERSRRFLEYYGSREGQLFLTQQVRWLAAAAFALLSIFNLTDLDREITQRFFDAAHGNFPLANDWWLKAVLHDAARVASAAGALAVLAITLVAWLVPRLLGAHSRRHELAFVSAAILLGAAVVATFKHYSAHACPWNIIDFGGLAPYRPLVSRYEGLLPIDGCFPAGHPLVGYAWLCVGFALHPGAPRAARTWTLAALLAGTVAGAVQVMRGAHFVSHVLWTAWAVWAIDLALLALYRLRGSATSGSRKCPVLAGQELCDTERQNHEEQRQPIIDGRPLESPRIGRFGKPETE